ncbi:hypothetical protein [Endozoicomonas numazuensis]|uniref:Uncharacterized protein n=1 Tax=Endozoicomonas numazuensis TaxID=1137799 RepID=A0A081NMT3_9GAMM|nr:hypothetical protein [Endozoicomonas numazuensis]KEQ19756.1 hypothetical protein GZ78_07775 [Endozoicomonas numazuensis]
MDKTNSQILQTDEFVLISGTVFQENNFSSLISIPDWFVSSFSLPEAPMKHLSRFFFLIFLTAGFTQVALSDNSDATDQPTIAQAASLVTTSYSCQDINTGKYYVVSFLNMEGVSTPELASQALRTALH